jgi:hypothetical protein
MPVINCTHYSTRCESLGVDKHSIITRLLLLAHHVVDSGGRSRVVQPAMTSTPPATAVVRVILVISVPVDTVEH